MVKLGAALLLVQTASALSLWESAQTLLGESRLIVTSQNEPPQKVSEWEKLRLKREGVNFFDVTKHSWFYTKEEPIVVPKYNFPEAVHHNTTVKELIEQVDEQNLRDRLGVFSSFYSRYYKSDSGRASAKWLLETIDSIVANSTQAISVKPFNHEWQQFSIIVSIKGSKNPKKRVVVGCHQDSANLLLPNLMKAPGADDDGSGVTTNLEALRILVESKFQPENTLEFHFYSAEEGGLLGSLDIFTNYRTRGLEVVSMLQQDMTGYVQKTLDNGVEEHVGVIGDNVNPELTEFVKLIVDSYLAIPWRETKCGYACSDHASALKNGYPSAFIIESDFKYTNPHIHSTGDTLDRLSFSHVAEFTKLVLGYSVELGLHSFKRVDV